MDNWLVETELSERFPFYTRANIGEVFPDPVTPLSFSFAIAGPAGLGAAEHGFRDAYIRIGALDADELPPDRNVFLGVAGGYSYLNASVVRLLGHRAPGMSYKDIDDSFFGDAPGVPPFVAQPGDDRPDLTEELGESFGWALTAEGLPDIHDDEHRLHELRDARPELSELADRELLDRAWTLLATRFRELFARHVEISVLSTVPVGIISGVCRALDRPTDALKLLAGLGDVESAFPSTVLWELSREVAASAVLTGLFDAGHRGLDARLRASDDDTVRLFVADLDHFLVRFGSRGPNEWEVRSPTWEIDPDLALAAVDRMRLAPDEAEPGRHQEQRAGERRRLSAEITGQLSGDPQTQARFQAALHAATVLMPGRERTKTNCIKLIHEARMALRQWGSRMLDRGVFPSLTSYALLTREEQYAALERTDGLRDELARREALYQEVASLQEPFLFVGSPPPMRDYPRRTIGAVDPLTPGACLQGMAGCPGVGRGRARVVLDCHDPTALQPGDVLVAPTTDPSWTPLFVPASAVVVDVGAPLSHAVIVSRELGIPCVVSATGATRRIPDGALVEVDGDLGMVRVLAG